MNSQSKKTEMMLNNLFNYIDNTIYRNDLKLLTKQVISLKYQEFLNLPASIKFHHDYTHGLIVHTLEVVEGIKYILNTTTFNISKTEKDILLVSAFLHDFAKVEKYEQYDIDEFYTKSYQDYKKWWYTNYSEESAICVELSPLYIREVAINLNIDSKIINKITLIIQGHHGIEEWGSKYNLIDVVSEYQWTTLLFAADYASSQLLNNKLETSKIKPYISKETLSDSNKIFNYLKNDELFTYMAKNEDDVYNLVCKILKNGGIENENG